MSYLGSSATPIPVAFSGVRTQSLSGNGSTSLFTLNRAVTLVTDIEVVVNNVQQSPFDGSYSLVNNGLGLQFSENVSAGTNNIYVIYRDQPVGSLIDPTAVRKAGDTMTGTLTVGGNLLVSAESGGVRTIGAASGTNTTVVLQASTTIGGGPNIELTKDNVAYFDSNIIKFRSTDASLTYGGFDTAGRLTVPNQPAFKVWTTGFSKAATWEKITGFSNTSFNVGSNFSSSTSRFTAPVSGYYLFSAGGWANANSSGSRYAFSLTVNGGAYLMISGGPYSATDSPMNSHSEPIYLNANDYVELHGFSAVSTIWGNGSHVFWWAGRLLG